MEGRCTPADATDKFILELYGTDSEKPLTYTELLEYYSQVSSGVPDDSVFELIVFKAWSIAIDGFDVAQTLNKLRVIVYKNRIRLQEFFQVKAPTIFLYTCILETSLEPRALRVSHIEY